MKMKFLAAAVALLCAAPHAQAAVPEAFSPKAKELLTSSIRLAPSAHQVNVVYFLGNDNEPVPDYERRISELLLYLQQFYGKEMQRNGFGPRSFGLDMKENGHVNILLIRGSLPHTDYSYSVKGAEACLRDINAYFNEHPEQKKSRHTFIIMPTFYDERNNDKTPGGVPFFGYGRNCFALDYADFDIKHLGNDTPEGRLLTKWYGGFAHELGHGLNLPHNNGSCSQNAERGTALMNAGNYTFGLSPTYMTKATCAILDCSETFAENGNTTAFYPEPKPAPTMEDVSLVYGENAMELSFESRGDWAHVNAYLQDPPYAINQDYDAVAFTAETSLARCDGKRHVKLVFPYAEFASLRHENERQLEVFFIGKDGNGYRWKTLLNMNKLRARNGSDALGDQQPHYSAY